MLPILVLMYPAYWICGCGHRGACNARWPWARRTELGARRRRQVRSGISGCSKYWNKIKYFLGVPKQSEMTWPHRDMAQRATTEFRASLFRSGPGPEDVGGRGIYKYRGFTMSSWRICNKPCNCLGSNWQPLVTVREKNCCGRGEGEQWECLKNFSIQAFI